MSELESTAGQRRRRGTNRRGDPCSERVVTASGYCVVHDPESPVDMRELGRRGGRVGKGNAQLRRSIAGGPNLREYLLENVSPQEVWGALKAAMEGSSEAARVSAAKVLLDALQERQQDRDRQADAVGAKERLIRLLDDRAAQTGPAEKAQQVCELLDEIAAEDRDRLTPEQVREMRDRLAVVEESSVGAGGRGTPERLICL